MKLHMNLIEQGDLKYFGQIYNYIYSNHFMHIIWLAFIKYELAL